MLSAGGATSTTAKTSDIRLSAALFVAASTPTVSFFRALLGAIACDLTDFW